MNNARKCRKTFTKSQFSEPLHSGFVFLEHHYRQRRFPRSANKQQRTRLPTGGRRPIITRWVTKERFLRRKFQMAACLENENVMCSALLLIYELRWGNAAVNMEPLIGRYLGDKETSEVDDDGSYSPACCLCLLVCPWDAARFYKRFGIGVERNTAASLGGRYDKSALGARERWLPPKNIHLRDYTKPVYVNSVKKGNDRRGLSPSTESSGGEALIRLAEPRTNTLSAASDSSPADYGYGYQGLTKLGVLIERTKATGRWRPEALHRRAKILVDSQDDVVWTMWKDARNFYRAFSLSSGQNPHKFYFVSCKRKKVRLVECDREPSPLTTHSNDARFFEIKERPKTGRLVLQPSNTDLYLTVNADNVLSTTSESGRAEEWVLREYPIVTEEGATGRTAHHKH